MTLFYFFGNFFCSFMGNYRDDFSTYDIVLFFLIKNHFSFYGKNPICIDTIGKKKNNTYHKRFN